MFYKLVDDYDYTVTGIITTDRNVEYIQDLIDRCREQDDGYWDSMMAEFKKNGIQFTRIDDVPSALY